ncbi:MAG: C10 family peptidase [Prevotella sp.]|uniref:C10 family peptidase n=1 Tax=Prevotella sp. TaxID=59823 RepID=UPI00258CB0F0|nr:C10 family peptidase [Prevotella sp.]MDD6854098.1 C10 family peptidase [Prevotella sp.]
MSKLKLLILILFSSFLIVSCEDDSTLSVVTKTETKDIVSQVACEFANSINSSESTTRALSSISVVSLSKLALNRNSAWTRASISSEDTIYSASLSDNKGSVILIKRASNVLPLAYFRDEKELDLKEILSDTISDKAFVIQSVIEDVSANNSLANINASQDYSVVERLLPKCKVSWSQDSPYNRYCFTSDGKQAKAGCVAIAGAQALSVLQPKMSIISSWENAIATNPSSQAINEVARLVSYIGKQTGMKYGVSSSGTKADKLVGLFAKYGITNYGGAQNINVLKTKHGIIVISGYRAKHGWGPWKHYVDGHAFIADGYVKYNRAKDPYYMHLNYGWGNFYNKDVYVLSSKGRWDEEKGRETYGTIFPHKIKFFAFTFPSEKNWR